MNKDEFIQLVMKLTGISDWAVAERQSMIVLQTFKSQLSRNEKIAISKSIPAELAGLWRGRWFERVISKIQGLQGMSVEDLIEQTREATALRTPAEAEQLTRAVLAALKASLPPRDIQNVGHDLPSDINQFWLAA